MSSLSARLLISVSVLLLFFFGVTIVVLNTAFRSAGEQSREDVLDGHLMALLAAAEPAEQGELEMPVDLHDPRLSSIGSGLYAEIRNTDGVVRWRSRSALGNEMPSGANSQEGLRLFEKESLTDGTPILILSLPVQWEFPDGELKPFVFRVAESMDSFNAQVARFRKQLSGWFAAVALVMLLAISAVLRGLLKPLRQIETEIGAIEEGKRQSLSGQFPTELEGVARNMNLLIDSERARSDRYKATLDNLAHSLKTPLAAMRALLNQGLPAKFSDRIDEQIERMDEIVRYQLRKPATLATENIVLTQLSVAKEVDRLVDGLRKVYHDKEPEIETALEDGIQFRGDKGDFLELAGNLLDNACKWCQSRVRITVRQAVNEAGVKSGIVLSVADDGPGIPADSVDDLLQRGTRLDESAPGHGIGLAIVKELAESYGGQLEISQSEFGGAEFRVTIPAS